MIKLILQVAFIIDTLVEALIIVRILLSIFSANLSNMYVAWVFSVSDLCIAPFTGITADTLVIDNFQISITPVVALVFFAIVGFVLSELLKAFKDD